MLLYFGVALWLLSAFSGFAAISELSGDKPRAVVLFAVAAIAGLFAYVITTSPPPG